MAPDPKPAAPAENGLHISRLPAVPVGGRPPIPPPDPRVEAAKTWSETARGAAREAFERATTAGGSREEAIEAGYLAGLRVQLEEKKLSPPAADLATYAASLFGARVVGVLPAGRETTALEERCFEMQFPDEGFPKPARRPATPTRRRESADEDKKATPAKDSRAALTGKLAGRPRAEGPAREARSA
jgi:hypothetical protein